MSTASEHDGAMSKRYPKDIGSGVTSRPPPDAEEGRFTEDDSCVVVWTTIHPDGSGSYRVIARFADPVLAREVAAWMNLRRIKR